MYNGIIKNKKFCEAYKKIESSYAKLIKDYDKSLKKLKGVMAKKKGYSLEIKSDYIWLYRGNSGQGFSRFTADYKKLLKEMNKSRYKSIHNRLVR